MEGILQKLQRLSKIAQSRKNPTKCRKITKGDESGGEILSESEVVAQLGRGLAEGCAVTFGEVGR
jgi:hypothetical protein